MPTTPLRNFLYRAALPLLAPSPRGQMRHAVCGRTLTSSAAYERILTRHHVLGASLLLTDGPQWAAVHTSVDHPRHVAGPSVMYRTASITKMATTMVTLMLCGDGAFSLDTPVSSLLPDGSQEPMLSGITVRQLLCHTSGLRDIPAYEATLRQGGTFLEVLHQPGVRASQPGEEMVYCNFGFGLLGCVLEAASGQGLEMLFQERLFRPLGMRATLDASTLAPDSIMPLSRILPYRAGHDVTIPPLGHTPLFSPDPLHHFGHTAGGMYTDAPSLSRMLRLLAEGGCAEEKQLLSPALVHEMTREQSHAGPASHPVRRYGLGLVILSRRELSAGPIYGHQGFAYGCVDGAFWEAETGRQVIFLNGGASEARDGLLGLCNRDLLAWALKKEIPSWT